MLLFSVTAEAANEEGVFVSNDSILLGGAARSVVADGGAAWLNPARLTQIERLSVMGNLNALRLSHERIPHAIDVQNGSSSSIVQTNVAVLPGSMSMGAFINERLSIGAGMFVTRSESSFQNLRMRHESPVREYDLVLGLTSRDQDYNAVIALGWKANERASYGLSLVFRYGRQSYTMTNWSYMLEANSESLQISTLQQQLTRAGLGVILGGAWQLDEQWRLSAVLHPPTLMLVDSERSTSVEGGAERNGELDLDYQVMQIRHLSSDARPLGSVRGHIGVAWETPKLLVSGELEMRLEPGVAKKGYVPVWNARLGVQAQLSRRMQLGGGIFSDVTQRVRLEDFYTKNLQYMGASVGMRFTKIIHLDARERVRTIERTTVIGARYLLGIGQFGATTLDLEQRTSSMRSVRYFAHELSLYLGAEFAF